MNVNTWGKLFWWVYLIFRSLTRRELLIKRIFVGRWKVAPWISSVKVLLHQKLSSCLHKFLFSEQSVNSSWKLRVIRYSSCFSGMLFNELLSSPLKSSSFIWLSQRGEQFVSQKNGWQLSVRKRMEKQTDEKNLAPL